MDTGEKNAQFNLSFLCSHIFAKLWVSMSKWMYGQVTVIFHLLWTQAIIFSLVLSKAVYWVIIFLHVRKVTDSNLDWVTFYLNWKIWNYLKSPSMFLKRFRRHVQSFCNVTFCVLPEASCSLLRCRCYCSFSTNSYVVCWQYIVSHIDASFIYFQRVMPLSRFVLHFVSSK